MKTTTISSIALATIIGAGLALPTAASAAPESLTSEGVIKYVEDDTKNPIIDPEDPNPLEPLDPTTPIVPNPDSGLLSIDAVTDLNFMTQKAVLTDQKYFAKQVAVFKNGVADGTRGNFVQVTDKRIDTRSEWTLSAKMTQQFTAETSGNVLKASTLTFSNPYINSFVEDKTKWPELSSAAKASFVLNESGNSVMVMGTKDKNKGIGSYTVEFGTSKGINGALKDTTGTPDVANPNKINDGSVELFVPGETTKTKETYIAKVLWSVSQVPVQ